MTLETQEHKPIGQYYEAMMKLLLSWLRMIAQNLLASIMILEMLARRLEKILLTGWFNEILIKKESLFLTVFTLMCIQQTPWVKKTLNIYLTIYSAFALLLCVGFRMYIKAKDKIDIHEFNNDTYKD